MSDTKIILIAAAAENHVIGKNNQMAWHLPNDFRYFKQKTLHHSVVMGRKTFDAMGKALPDRRNIVVTRDQHWSATDVDVADSLHEVFNYCRDEREIFVIGGGEIYRQALPMADQILLTRVHAVIDGDATFPEIDPALWKRTKAETHQRDERHAYDYTFEVYERI